MIQLYIYMCICICIFFFFTFFSLKGYYYIIGIILYYIKGTEYSSLCYTVDPCGYLLRFWLLSLIWHDIHMNGASPIAQR